ncbi:MAG: LysE family transporter [Lewinellaceae bacterium]|nr:LysE family transporter [Lewinellaceae bacterium]
MKSIFRVFYSGMSISFFGSMVIGTIGLSAMQISITEGIRPAINFSIGSIVAEVIYVRLLLVALTWIQKHERIFKIMEWVAVLIVVVLAIASFKAALGHHGAKNVVLSYTMHRFFLGLMMRAISPASIPFWLGWSSVLYTKGIMQDKKGFYNGYLLGIAIGTFAAHCVFIFGGKMAVQKLDAGQEEINFVIGCIFSITAILQIWKILKKKYRSTKAARKKQ